MRAWMLGLLLWGSAWAQGPTLLESVRDLKATAAALAPSGGNVSWGQQQAIDDLGRLGQTLTSLEGALQPGPSDLRPLIDALAACDLRLKASLPLLTDPAHTAAVLTPLEQVERRLRDLGLRFDGKARPLDLGRAALTGPLELPEYPSPAELAIEARNVKGLAEQLSRPRWGWRTGRGLGTGDWYGQEMHDFLIAAYDYATVCSTSYQDVHQTEPAWRRLRTTYERASRAWSFEDTLRMNQLQKAMDRLERFYTSLG